MTLSQLRAFALVARLGSMRSAALALGVSEPAVSAAVAALRQDLGDALVVRSGGGIALTAGGRRLAAHADEIVGLAEQARREVAAAGTSSDVLRVGVTAAFAEHAAGPLIDAFTRRSPGTKVELVRAAPDQLREALVDRSVDLVLGTRPQEGGVALTVVPFLRYQRVVVAAPGHRLAAGVVPRQGRPLHRERWLTGRDGVEELSEEGRWLAASRLLPELVACSGEADALERAREGEGVFLALAHVVRADLARGTLVRLPVDGTPVQGLWHASMLGHDRALTAARALLRFTTTPDATGAMVAGVGAAATPRRLPPVHVTLWS